MCGIVGVLRFDGSPVDENLLVSMRDTMFHRGPDDAGVHIDGSTGLGHRRLSIVDLSPLGHQPMCNEDGTVWLVFNGEIYNYVELADGLRRRGHQFRSSTDSEVIVHLYEEHGAKCVEHLNGMFSFAIWDARRRRLFGARDRLGIKPFYYHSDARQFVFASEIKAIIADPAVPRAPDHRGIADYMFAGAPLADRTFFEGIHQLPPGQTISVDSGGVKTSRYWDLRYDYDAPRGNDEVVDELYTLLDDAVRIHCRSDAALGAHLSGGLDSSTVSALAAHHVRALKTFSIRFDRGGIYDETRFAKLVSGAIGSEYVEAQSVSGQLASLYPFLIWHMDQPPAGGGDGGFSYYAAAELASRHVKVALTGHGGDEIFAGYPAQFQTAFGRTDMFAAAAAAPTAATSGLGGRAVGVWRRHGLRGLFRRAIGRLASKGPLSAEDTWISLHCGLEPARDDLLSSRFVAKLGGYSPVVDYLAPFRDAPTDRLLDRCLHHDLSVYLPQLLHKEDRASMAVSIESRVPLLDHRIVEFMARLSPEQKLPRMEPKALLRQCASRHLPAEVADRRDKIPFAVPMKFWVTEGLKPLIDEVVHGAACYERGIFDPDALRSDRVTPEQTLMALNVELWFRLFIDQDEALMERARAPQGRSVAAG